MSASSVKKELSQFPKEELVVLMMELYKKFPDVKAFLNFYVDPNEAELMEKYLVKIEKALGFGVKLKTIRKSENIVKEFMKYETLPETRAEILMKLLVPLLRNEIYHMDSSKGAKDTALRLYQQLILTINEGALESMYQPKLDEIFRRLTESEIYPKLMSIKNAVAPIVDEDD
jgi:hypothetical protein